MLSGFSGLWTSLNDQKFETEMQLPSAFVEQIG
jgi:hypothetical protein